jgi:hypothetical protein
MSKSVEELLREIDGSRAGSTTARFPWTHFGSIGLSHGALTGNGQVMMRTPRPSCLTCRLCSRIQLLTALLMCHDALSHTSSKAVFPRAARRVQQSARNSVVMALTGRPSTKRSQSSSVDGRSRPYAARALGSGSSFATDCSTSRSGSSVQVWREGRARRVHQVSSPKPRTQSGCCAARRISQSRRLFFVRTPGPGW